jgi:O-antigen biosynthesis protein
VKILWLHRQPSAVGSYRCKSPARWLSEHKLAEVTCPSKPYPILKPSPQAWLENYLDKDYDILAVDRAINMNDLPLLAGFRHHSPNCRMVVDTDDDWTKVPWWNTAHGSYKPGQGPYEAGRAHFKLAEITSVSTEPLTKAFASMTHSVKVAPNGIDPRDWEGLPMNPDRSSDPRVRILYGGASGHYGDMDDAREGLEAIIANPPVPMRLICFGAVPQWIHEASKKWPDRVVRLPWVSFEDYPAAVAWGGFDIAIAPLAVHPFNDCKSNIKWLEAGAQRIPFLCSDVGPYSEIPSDCAVKVSNTPIQWAEGLSALLKDTAFRERLKTKAYEAVHDQFTIDKTAPKWLEVFQEAKLSKRILSLEDTRLGGQ